MRMAREPICLFATVGALSEAVDMYEAAFKNIDDTLQKDAGCSGELDYTEQTSWMRLVNQTASVFKPPKPCLFSSSLARLLPREILMRVLTKFALPITVAFIGLFAWGLERSIQDNRTATAEPLPASPRSPNNTSLG